MTRAVHNLVEHLNEHVEYYTSAILWNLDRNRLFMMLDGFYVPGTNGISIASVVERDPIAIIGNSLVFRVSAGAFLGLGSITTPAQLREHYVAKHAPSDPMLLSLPTDGLYAQTLMDECSALEEHGGNTDWALADPDPDLGTIAPELLTSRRAEPLPTAPTPFPQSIINLQNAPEAPPVSGLGAALAAVQNPNAFRDMAGLAGTQANAAAALQAAAGLATTFGGQAAALKLADMAKEAQAAQSADQKLATVQRAIDKSLVTSDEGKMHASKILESLYEPSGISTEEVQNLTRTAGENGADVAMTREGEQVDVKTAKGDGGLESLAAALFGGAGTSKKPKQAPTTKADALQLVTDFRNRTSDPKFIVDKTKFATRMEELIDDPTKVDQADLFLCGPAAFLRVWIGNDPVGFAKYGIQLFEEGRGYIGSKKIKPSSALRNTTWSSSWAKAAEWVTMSSLRDSENAVFDYTGKPDEEFDGATSPGEMVEWLQATGLYEMVSEKASIFSTEDLVYLKAAKPSARVDVLLFINANLLQGTKSKPEHWFLGETANHYIVLYKPVRYSGDDAILEYWSWGEDFVGTKKLTVPKSKLASNFYGWIQAWKHRP